MGETIYSLEDRFYIDIDGELIQIREPVGWDKIKITLKRDTDYYGLDYSFPDKSATLKFTCDPLLPSGTRSKEVIDKIWAEKGPNAKAELVFGQVQSGNFVEFSRITLDWKAYKQSETNSSIKTEEISLKKTLKNKLTIDTYCNSPTAIDGESITPATKRITELHAKLVAEDYDAEVGDEDSEGVRMDRITTGNTFVRYLNFSFPVVNKNEVETLPGDNTGWTIFNPKEDKLWRHEAKLGGTFSYNFDLNATIQAQLGSSGAFSEIRSSVFKLFFEIPSLGINQELYSTTNLSNGGAGLYFLNVTQNYDLGTYNLNKGDEVYIYASWQFFVASNLPNPNIGGGNLDFDTDLEYKAIAKSGSRFIINGESQDASSSAITHKLFDAIQHNLRAITGNDDPLVSTFLNTEANNYVYTNGNQIRRKFNTTILAGAGTGTLSRPNESIRINFKDAIESLKAIFWVGYNIEDDGNGEKFRIEQGNYFFANTQLLVMDEISNLEIVPSTDFIYSELEFKFPPNVDEEKNTLDAIHTERKYKTLISEMSKKYIQASKWRADAYDIEFTRRKREDTESFKTDDDGFIIASNSSFTAAEKDEAFQQVDNVVGRDSAYNLRITPARNYLNHAPLTNSCQLKEGGTSEVQNTFTKNNGQAVTKFLSSETNRLGEKSGRVSITENQNFRLERSQDFNRLFGDTMLSWRKRIDYDTAKLIIDNHRGAGALNYGYITIPGFKGEAINTYIMDFSFDPKSNMGEFKAIEKGNL